LKKRPPLPGGLFVLQLVLAAHCEISPFSAQNPILEIKKGFVSDEALSKGGLTRNKKEI